MQKPHITHVTHILKNIPRWMGENTFFGFLLLFFVALVISSAVFYQYVFSARDATLQAEIQTNFREEILQDVVGIWQERAAQFEQAGKVPERNIFISGQQAAGEEGE